MTVYATEAVHAAHQVKENTMSTSTDSIAFTNARILAQGISQSNDTRLTGLNNNDLIIGPTGAGKTRGYVIPNILHDTDESLVVADTKGNLHETFRGHLEAHGYEVHVIDFVDCLHSESGYDPIRCIGYDDQTKRYSEQDILRVSAALCPVTNLRDPYWEQASQMTLASLIALTLERFDEEDHSMSSVCRLVSKLGSEWLEGLFDDLALSDPSSFAVREYRMATINKTAEKMVASVMGILSNALNPLSFDGAQHLFKGARTINMARIGRTKTALFITVSDNDRSLDRLVNTFYTQLIQELVREADRQPFNRLPVPVRIILDDFATNTVIPHFDKMITTIRSRGIAVSLIVQDLTQLKALYGNHRGPIIANNCDTWLYLGGQDASTARLISDKLNRTVSSVLELGLDEVFLMQRGSKPRQIRKYDLGTDDAYEAIMEKAAQAEDESCAEEDPSSAEDELRALIEEAETMEVPL